MRPRVPFSLFDFKTIHEFKPRQKTLSSTAGIAIPSTVFYTCPDHKFALLLKLSVAVTKTTATALLVLVGRTSQKDEKVSSSEALISESANTGYYSWPSGKATGSHVLGWCLEFLFAGDTLNLSHALTAAETITDVVSWVIIEYDDPRYLEDER